MLSAFATTAGIRLVTYGVLAGSTEMIQDMLVGAREMYNSLGVPMPGMVEAMKTMKDASLALYLNNRSRLPRRTSIS